ncbi:hypothetical protein PVAND_005390 [Polypedilum vanderplanki]|uniref:Uncharacterized protein n=1 Tax=Polypedilum vanderplanki TaxID=319348 RepID=A0A9J6C0F6_POLVA|nr:hypothetical protein PVAND_005390 [Polypedilum vanderplanki]
MKTANQKKVRGGYSRGIHTFKRNNGIYINGEPPTINLCDIFEETYKRMHSYFKENEELEAKYISLLNEDKRSIKKWILFSSDVWNFHIEKVKKIESNRNKIEIKNLINIWSSNLNCDLNWNNPNNDQNDLHKLLKEIQKFCIFNATGCIVYHRYVRFNTLINLVKFKTENDCNNIQDVGSSIKQALYLINTNLPSIFMIGNEIRINNKPYLRATQEEKDEIEIPWNDVIVIFEKKNVFIYDQYVSKKLKTEFKEKLEKYDVLLKAMKKEWQKCKRLMTYTKEKNEIKWKVLKQKQIKLKDLTEFEIIIKYKDFFDEKFSEQDEFNEILVKLDEKEKKYINNIKRKETKISKSQIMKIKDVKMQNNILANYNIVNYKNLKKSMILFAQKHYKYYLIYESEMIRISENLIFTEFVLPDIKKGNDHKIKQDGIEQGKFITTFNKTVDGYIYEKLNTEIKQNMIYLREIRGMQRTIEFIKKKTKFSADYEYYFSFGADEYCGCTCKKMFCKLPAIYFLEAIIKFYMEKSNQENEKSLLNFKYKSRNSAMKNKNWINAKEHNRNKKQNKNETNEPVTKKKKLK